MSQQKNNDAAYVNQKQILGQRSRPQSNTEKNSEKQQKSDDKQDEVSSQIIQNIEVRNSASSKQIVEWQSQGLSDSQKQAQMFEAHGQIPKPQGPAQQTDQQQVPIPNFAMQNTQQPMGPPMGPPLSQQFTMQEIYRGPNTPACPPGYQMINPQLLFQSFINGLNLQQVELDQSFRQKQGQPIQMQQQPPLARFEQRQDSMSNTQQVIQIDSNDEFQNMSIEQSMIKTDDQEMIVNKSFNSSNNPMSINRQYMNNRQHQDQQQENSFENREEISQIKNEQQMPSNNSDISKQQYSKYHRLVTGDDHDIMKRNQKQKDLFFRKHSQSPNKSAPISFAASSQTSSNLAFGGGLKSKKSEKYDWTKRQFNINRKYGHLCYVVNPNLVQYSARNWICTYQAIHFKELENWFVNHDDADMAKFDTKWAHTMRIWFKVYVYHIGHALSEILREHKDQGHSIEDMRESLYDYIIKDQDWQRIQPYEKMRKAYSKNKSLTEEWSGKYDAVLQILIVQAFIDKHMQIMLRIPAAQRNLVFKANTKKTIDLSKRSKSGSGDRLQSSITSAPLKQPASGGIGSKPKRVLRQPTLQTEVEQFDMQLFKQANPTHQHLELKEDDFWSIMENPAINNKTNTKSKPFFELLRHLYNKFAQYDRSSSIKASHAFYYEVYENCKKISTAELAQSIINTYQKDLEKLLIGFEFRISDFQKTDEDKQQLQLAIKRIINHASLVYASDNTVLTVYLSHSVYKLLNLLVNQDQELQMKVTWSKDTPDLVATSINNVLKEPCDQLNPESFFYYVKFQDQTVKQRLVEEAYGLTGNSNLFITQYPFKEAWNTDLIRILKYQNLNIDHVKLFLYISGLYEQTQLEQLMTFNNAITDLPRLMQQISSHDISDYYSYDQVLPVFTSYANNLQNGKIVQDALFMDKRDKSLDLQQLIELIEVYLFKIVGSTEQGQKSVFEDIFKFVYAVNSPFANEDGIYQQVKPEIDYGLYYDNDKTWFFGLEKEQNSYDQHLFQNYKMRVQKWQLLVMCAIVRAILKDFNMHGIDFYSSKLRWLCLIPPAHGKSILISAIAHMLVENNDKFRIWIITHNAYLNQCAFDKYRAHASSAMDAQSNATRVINLTWDEFSKLKATKFENGYINIALIDEIDAVVSQSLVNVQHLGGYSGQAAVGKQMMGQNEKLTAKSVSTYRFLSKASCLKVLDYYVGFTGSQSTLTKYSLNQTNKDGQTCLFHEMKISPLNRSNQNAITGVNTYKTLADKSKQIKAFAVEKLINNPVIIIDEEMNHENAHKTSYITELKKHCKPNQFFCIYDWGEARYAANKAMLKQINTLGPGTCIITNMSGSRGIDYKMNMSAHVILAFNPTNWADVVQGLSRGCRESAARCEGTFFISNEFAKQTEDLCNWEMRKQALITEYDVGSKSQQLKLSFIKSHHETTISLVGTKVKEDTQSLCDIFNKPLENITFQISQLTNLASAKLKNKHNMSQTNWDHIMYCFNYTGWIHPDECQNFQDLKEYEQHSQDAKGRSEYQQ